MRIVVLLGMVLSALPTAAYCYSPSLRGSIIQEWGYLTITIADGIECIITRRVGMQTVISTCDDKRCKVTGVINGPITHVGWEAISASPRQHESDNGKFLIWRN